MNRDVKKDTHQAERFEWFYNERYLPNKANGHNILVTEKNCKCGHPYQKVYDKTVAQSAGRHGIRYVNFEMKYADLCYGCGRNLELLNR
jgi:hypothetical protein